MRTFIELQEIESMCDISKCGRGYMGENQDGCSTGNNKQDKSEPKASKWLTFRTKCKVFGGEAKKLALGLVDVFCTATVLLKAYFGVKKVFRKMKVSIA